MSLEQEKQAEKRKTAKRMSETRPIVCKTKDDAKQRILELVNKGTSYRDIAPIPFLIDGNTRRFNISQISSIVNAKHEIVLEDEMGDTASKVFTLFQQGKTPTQAVIEMKLPPSKVKELYIQYNELKGLDTNLQNHLIRQFVATRDQVFLEVGAACPYCSNHLAYGETSESDIGWVCTKCKIFLEIGELAPQPIPKNIKIVQR